MVRINRIFSFFRFSIICEKWKNRKISQESEIVSFFSFSNNSKKIKNSKISLLAVYSIFGIFEADFKIRKMINFPDHFLFFYFCLYFKICKYDKNNEYFLFLFLLEKWKIRLAEVYTDRLSLSEVQSEFQPLKQKKVQVLMQYFQKYFFRPVA